MDDPMESKLKGRWRRHRICRVDLSLPAGVHKAPALLQNVTEQLDCSAAVPYLAYMPEKQRLIMLANYGESHTDPHVIFSSDQGAT